MDQKSCALCPTPLGSVGATVLIPLIVIIKATSFLSNLWCLLSTKGHRGVFTCLMCSLDNLPAPLHKG
ncbi:hypothetical protein XENTR_v10020178 [Xenopus tropicalis]|nr:hypothetical protein XENTR_v10020178 [Xenopus tropicalis]